MNSFGEFDLEQYVFLAAFEQSQTGMLCELEAFTPVNNNNQS